MGRSNELIAEETTFRELVGAVPGLRARVILDAEGWPMVRGRLGRLEWRGIEAMGSFTGTARLYAFTDSAHQIRKLRAIPGLRPEQVGDQEATFSLDAANHAAILTVARVLHFQIQRGQTFAGASPEQMRAMREMRKAKGEAA